MPFCKLQPTGVSFGALTPEIRYVGCSSVPHCRLSRQLLEPHFSDFYIRLDTMVYTAHNRLRSQSPTVYPSSARYSLYRQVATRIRRNHANWI